MYNEKMGREGKVIKMFYPLNLQNDDWLKAIYEGHLGVTFFVGFYGSPKE
jgi:hypothetical protein